MLPSRLARTLASPRLIPSAIAAAIPVTGRRAFATTDTNRDHFLNATPEQFEKNVIQGDKTVLVDFYADWCGPCRFLTPILKKVVPQNSPDIHLLTVDTDAQTKLAQTYKISSLPTVIAFKKGEVIGKFVGGIPEASVISFIKSLPT